MRYVCSIDKAKYERMLEVLNERVRRDAELQSRLQRWRLPVRTPEPKAASASKHRTRRAGTCSPAEGERAEHRGRKTRLIRAFQIEDVLLERGTDVDPDFTGLSKPRCRSAVRVGVGRHTAAGDLGERSRAFRISAQL
ncbi:hypothetical protein Q5P01_009680 [Channa striata]|uniref:Uncharacterized protein n=1 Tax=Channa striata TaxID=64152 RepID=A0AA88MZC8_CHASR|nr:hypothetical protein Q5P01_009680 [Channa striata]